MKATELMRKYSWSEEEFINLFLSEAIYQYYDGDIEFDI